MRKSSGVDAALLQAVELFDQDLGIDHAALAQNADGAGVEDAAGYQPQLVGLVADHERMSGVVATLVAGDHVGVAGEHVDDLALALIAPLGTDHDREAAHERPRLSNRV